MQNEKVPAAMQDNVTQADIQNAALYWVGQKDRETFPEDIAYAEANWQIIAPVKSLAEAFARHRLASTTAQSEAVQKLVEAVQREAKKADELAAYAVERDFDAMGEALDNMRHRLESALAAHRESQL